MKAKMTKKQETKYFYYFRGSLATHVQFFEAWTNAVRENGIPMELITFLDLSISRRDEISKCLTVIFLWISIWMNILNL